MKGKHEARIKTRGRARGNQPPRVHSMTIFLSNRLPSQETPKAVVSQFRKEKITGVSVALEFKIKVHLILNETNT